jgi:hypothetical protein
MNCPAKLQRSMHFYGASHAKRLFMEGSKINSISTKYQMFNHCLPGSTILTNPFPNFNHLTSSDVLIIQITGNNLFQKDISFEKTSKGKIIHLNSFCPREQSFIDKENQRLKGKLENLLKTPDKAPKVYLIDAIYRHLHCCKKHFDKRILHFQQKQNSIFRKLFKDLSPSLIVLNHLKCIKRKSRLLKRQHQLQKLTVDSVHLKRIHYRQILEKILSHC